MKLVFIVWVDAIGAWYTPKEAAEWGEGGPARIQEVGWVLDETPRHILLCGQLCNTRDRLQVGNLQLIPRPWIEEYTVIREEEHWDNWKLPERKQHEEDMATTPAPE